MTGKAVEILLAIVLALIPIVTPFVLRWLNVKVGASKMQQFVDLVKRMVQAAEMLGATSGWSGATKRAWAIGQIAALTKTDEETISAFVEEAVARLKVGWGESGELVKNGKGVVVKAECGKAVEA